MYSTFAQIEAAIEHGNDTLISEIRDLKNLENRTSFYLQETNWYFLCFLELFMEMLA